ncbi:MAG TPA: Ig-like domain-containing protein [Longimicrobiaceae bacterium]|nr:Ig-like domain-containing protein [Longimicrobiaceae bacterium]
MRLLKRSYGRPAALVGLALLAAACTDRGGTPVGPRGPGPGGPTTGKPVTFQAVECFGRIAEKTVTCEPATPEGGAAADLIVGNQNTYVKVSTSNVNYDAGLGRLTFDATVRNLIPQALGTTDGSTLDPTGVRVFFHSGPSVTGGTGTITVVPDGTATFTAPGQPYYQYNEVLSQYELSPAKQWRLDMPSTVTNFTFTLYVSAPVQFPNGWIEVQPAVHSMPALDDRQLSATVRTAVGNIDPAAVTWGSSDNSIATVSGTGLAEGVLAGTATLTASSTLGRTGANTMNITGIQRSWTGASDTNWDNGANWNPVGIVPHPTADTAVVPGDLTNYPLFTANEGIGGVIMQDGASVEPFINIGSFDFTLASSIDHGPTGLITGTGRMIFTGSGKTIDGGLTNVDYRNARFTNSYTINTNLNVTGGRIVVQGGRLRNTSHRIRVRPN